MKMSKLTGFLTAAVMSMSASSLANVVLTGEDRDVDVTMALEVCDDADLDAATFSYTSIEHVPEDAVNGSFESYTITSPAALGIEVPCVHADGNTPTTNSFSLNFTLTDSNGASSDGITFIAGSADVSLVDLEAGLVSSATLVFPPALSASNISAIQGTGLVLTYSILFAGP